MRTQLVGFPKNLPPGVHPARVTSIGAADDGKLTMILEPPAKNDLHEQAGSVMNTPEDVADAVAATLREYGWEVEDVQPDPANWILGARRPGSADMSMVFARTQ